MVSLIQIPEVIREIPAIPSWPMSVLMASYKPAGDHSNLTRLVRLWNCDSVHPEQGSRSKCRSWLVGGSPTLQTELGICKASSSWFNLVGGSQSGDWSLKDT